MATPTALKTLLHVPRHGDRRAKRLPFSSMTISWSSNRFFFLIFAPHVMLFERRFVLTIDKVRLNRRGNIDVRYLKAPNIRIDLGSRACTDMSYTLMADLYLGDVSSQVYEFLLRPRPCLFLNSQGVDWRNDPNYTQWQAGPVIDRPAQLATGLKRAFESHMGEYLAVQQQQQLFARTIDQEIEKQGSLKLIYIDPPSAWAPIFAWTWKSAATSSPISLIF